MFIKRLGAILCLLCVSALGLSAAEFYTPPVISVPQVASAPMIDGQIEAEEWSKAAVFSDFILRGGTDRPTLPTTVYVAYDAEAVYIGAQLFDPDPLQLRAEADERDGPVGEDDCLALFIDTAGEHRSYAHLVMNSLGTQYDAMNEDKSEDFRWEVATGIGDNGWTVELALPFANNIAPKPGDTWILNVARNAPGVGEQSSWARVRENLHEPENFGTLTFGERPFRVTIDDLGALWLGENTAWISAQALYKVGRPVFTGVFGPRPLEDVSLNWTAKLNVRVMGRDKRGHYFDSVKQIIDESEVTQVAVPYMVKQDGRSTVTFSLTDHEGTVRWRSGPYPVSVPPVSLALREAETSLGEALVIWSQMPPGPAKQALDQQLASLLKAWQYLDKRYQQREQMTAAELEALLAQVTLIKQQAKLALEQITLTED